MLAGLHGAAWGCVLGSGEDVGGAVARTLLDAARLGGAPGVRAARTLGVGAGGRVEVTPVRAWCAQVREGAREGSAPLLAVDNAQVGPWMCRPLAMGADVVAEALPAWLGAPGTLVCARTRAAGEAFLRAAGLEAPASGAQGPTPDGYARLLLATASARVQRRCDTALACAAYLEAHPAVAWVSYPGLPADAAQDAAHRTLEHGAGPLVGFGLVRAERARDVLARATADARLLGAPGAGLPGCDATRLSAGPAGGSLVLSCGLETPMDVVEALEAALLPGLPG